MVNAQKCLVQHNMTELSYFSASVTGVLMVTTIPVNVLMVLMFMRNVKLLRRSMFYKLIFNIAIADLLTALISNAVSMSFHLKEGLREFISQEETRLLHCGLFIINGTSVLSMALLCFDRVIAIVRPLTHRRGFSIKTSIMILLLTWLLSNVLSIPYFYQGYIRYLKIFSSVTVAVTFLSLIGSVIIFRIYLKPAHDIALRKMDVLEISSQSILVSSPTPSTASRDTNTRKHDKGSQDLLSRPKMTKQKTIEERVNESIVIMLLVFLLTYLPAVVLTVYMNSCRNCHCVAIHVMRDVTYHFILSSALWRPLNFILRIKTIRKKVVAMMTCREVICGIANKNNSEITSSSGV